MSRKVNETEHIYLYKDNQDELQIAFKHKDFTSVYYLNVGDGGYARTQMFLSM